MKKIILSLFIVCLPLNSYAQINVFDAIKRTADTINNLSTQQTQQDKGNNSQNQQYDQLDPTLSPLKGTINPPDGMPVCNYVDPKGKTIGIDTSIDHPEKDKMYIIINFNGKDRVVGLSPIGKQKIQNLTMGTSYVGMIEGYELTLIPGKVKSSGRGTETTSSTPVKFQLDRSAYRKTIAVEMMCSGS